MTSDPKFSCYTPYAFVVLMRYFSEHQFPLRQFTHIGLLIISKSAIRIAHRVRESWCPVTQIISCFLTPDHPKEFLQGFRGYLHVDGYVGYESLPGVILVGCWAHARRKFDEAIKALPAGTRKKPSRAREGMEMINKLFLIEQKVKKCTPQERKAQRDILSLPVVESFKTWLDTLVDAVLPKSALGTAITYCRNQWPKLTRFLEDGRLEIDNNRSERSIKPFVMGRKAWLFANTPRGARASAIIYSIVETAKENKLNPYEYLKHLFEQFLTIDAKESDAVKKLLPWNVELPEKSLT